MAKLEQGEGPHADGASVRYVSMQEGFQTKDYCIHRGSRSVPHSPCMKESRICRTSQLSLR